MAIRGASLTWDPVWQDGTAPTGVAVALAILAVAVAATIPTERALALPPTLRLALFGPLLAMELLFLQNAAALASQAAVALPVALAIVLLSDLLALWVAGLRRPIGPPLAVSLAVLAVVGGFLLPDVTRSWAWVVFAAEQVLLVLLLRRSLIAEPTGGGHPPGRLAWSLALESLGLVGLALLYQIHYRIPLPVTNAVIPAAATAMIGMGAIVRHGTIPTRIPKAAGAAPLVALLVPAAVWLTRRHCRSSH